MTQHILQEHTEEDVRTMRRLAAVIGSFVVATAIPVSIITSHGFDVERQSSACSRLLSTGFALEFRA